MLYFVMLCCIMFCTVNYGYDMLCYVGLSHDMYVCNPCMYEGMYVCMHVCT